jgi:hypothetical protein
MIFGRRTFGQRIKDYLIALDKKIVMPNLFRHPTGQLKYHAIYIAFEMLKQVQHDFFLLTNACVLTGIFALGRKFLVKYPRCLSSLTSDDYVSSPQTT